MSVVVVAHIAGESVFTLDGMSGDVTLVEGTGVTIVDGVGTITISASGGSSTVELRTVTSGEAVAKQLTLGATPTTPTFTELAIAGAPSQFYGDDFTVSGAVLSWTGLGLDGILTTGDRLTITYN